MKKMFLLLFALVAGLSVWAQNDMHANVNLQFRFTNPGARAQSMGGAFIGLADDTTAIFSNPGGLVHLSSKTLILEANHVERDNSIPFFGGTITQTGVQDFEFDLQSRDFSKGTTTVPFFAYANPKGKVRWGVFYTQQAKFERDFVTDGVGVPSFLGRPVSRNSGVVFPPSRNNVDLELNALGGSLAVALSSAWSAGITLTYSQLSYRGNTTLLVPDFNALLPEENIILPPIIEEQIGDDFAVIDVDGEDEAIGLFGGIFYKPNERFSVGFSYRLQPEFDYDFATTQLDFLTRELQPVEAGTATFGVPDSFGAGFAFKPTETITVAVDVQRIAYSELVDDFKSFFNTSSDPTGGGQTISDVTQYHVGFEYFVLSLANPLALRAGYWFEPYHALVNNQLDTQLLFGFVNEAGDFVQGNRQTPFLQRFEEDLNHITFGLGLTFGPKFALDFSADISSADSSFSLSGIYRY